MAYTGNKPTNVVDVSETQSLTVDGDLTVDTNTLKVDSTNNRVGIGTTTTDDAGVTITNSVTRVNSWDAKLALQSTGDSDFPALVFSGAASTNRYGGILSTTDITGNVPANETAEINFVLSSTTAGNITFRTNGNIGTTNTSERMRIDSSGNVQIATTTSPSTSVFGIHLNATGLFKSSRDAAGGGAVAQIFGNAGEARIMGDGDLLNTNNSYGQISDETLKQDIADAASQWADIKALKVRKFRFKDNPTGNLQIGVIAQELEASGMNGLVKQIDLNQDEDSEETIKAVKYSVLHMKAVKALQEAMERIEALETKVAALEAG